MDTYDDDLLRSLCRRHALMPLGAGLYEQGHEFQVVRDGVANALRSTWQDTVDMAVAVPPVLPVELAVRTEYATAFPHLLLVGMGFSGEPDKYRALVAKTGGRGGSVDEWASLFDQPRLVLTAAACHGVYPVIPRPLPSDGLRVEALATCVRNERSAELGRFLCFHMLELVQVGHKQRVQSFIAEFVPTVSTMLERLGLPHQVVHAADPFFLGNRLTRLVGRGESRKEEFVVNIVPASPSPIAVGSINDHGDHFTRIFDISDDNGSTVSACIGFGLERIVLCLYGQHGLEPGSWPSDVRRVLRQPSQVRALKGAGRAN